MIQLLIVGMGGFVGAVARWGMTGLMQRIAGGSFPVGTMVVNILGCFFLGLLMVLIEVRESIPESIRLFIGIGLLGSFTTFSTFGNETLELIRSGSIHLALVNVFVSVVVGLGAVWLGRCLAQAC
jgi:fluoride exporter